jgi:hypothetical protein
MAASNIRDAEAIVTWRSAVTQSLITAFIPVMGWLNFPNAGRSLAITRWIALAWAIGLLLLLRAERAHPTKGVALAAFGLAPLPLFPMYLLMEHERNARGLPLELFARENIISVVYALATPPNFTVGLLIICAFTLQAMLMYWFGGYPVSGETLRFEPWSSLICGGFAAVLAWYRAQRLRREVSLLAKQERAASLQRVARTFLAIRDLANTPIQTLRVALALLRARHPEEQELAAKMDRSLDRLRDMNEILATDENAIDWYEGESFDSVQALQRLSSRGETP